MPPAATWTTCTDIADDLLVLARLHRCFHVGTPLQTFPEDGKLEWRCFGVLCLQDVLKMQ